MHENFIALDAERRDRIINAAMCEFAAKGFKNASTNEIVKAAGISKGALFHYFATKKDLLEFLYRYSIDLFMEVIDPHIQTMSTDVFERWISFAALKMEIAAQYPGMADFMQTMYRDGEHAISGLLRAEFERYASMLQEKIYAGIDLSRFKSDVDPTTAFQIIWWVLEGYAVSKQKVFSDQSRFKSAAYLDTMIREMEVYLSLLKKAFYQETL